MIKLSTGVSKGDYDIVKDVLDEQGRMEFWSVRMRPAKPLAFGTLIGSDGRDVPHLGLPGNPVSALVAFEQFGRPAILKLMGKTDLERPTIEAVLEDPIYNGDGRRVYARAVVTKRKGVYYAKLTGHQDSNLLSSMAKANGLAICPEEDSVKDTKTNLVGLMSDNLLHHDLRSGHQSCSCGFRHCIYCTATLILYNATVII